MHKKLFQLNHTDNLLSSDEVPIMDPKLMTEYWLSIVNLEYI